MLMQYGATGGGGFGLDLPAGLSTVIGALPFRSVAEVSRFVLDRIPRLVSAPPITLDAEHPQGVRDGVDPIAQLRLFLMSMAGRAEPIVLNLTGPVTVDLDLRRHGATATEGARRAVELVVDRARLMLDAAEEFVPAADVLLVLDEPGLENSMHPTFPIGPDEITRLEAQIVDHLSSRSRVGVRVSGRADWAGLLRSGIAVLGAPVTAQLESAGAEIGAFLERGGVIVWGAVPTDEPLGASAERLWKRLSLLWSELVRGGTDPQLLRERSIITIAGGLGGFGVSQTERVVALTQDLASRVWRQAKGLQLSIGA